MKAPSPIAVRRGPTHQRSVRIVAANPLGWLSSAIGSGMAGLPPGFSALQGGGIVSGLSPGGQRRSETPERALARRKDLEARRPPAGEDRLHELLRQPLATHF